jgi:plasmid stability protein
MPAITVRNLSEETHRALKVRAAQHGRSTEAEIREILGAAVKPALGLGTALAGAWALRPPTGPPRQPGCNPAKPPPP